MDRYELEEGKSSKFWEVDVDGTTLTVRFGRIGTDGQTKAKSFADAAAATKEKDKLVREKTGKGYALAGDAGSAPPASAPAKAAASTKVAAPAPEAREKAPSNATTDAVVAEPASPKPQSPRASEAGSIFDGVALPSRSRPGPPLDPAADWAAFATLVRPLLSDAPKGVSDRADRLAARLDHEPEALDTLEAVEWVSDMLAACPAMDQRLWDAKPLPQGPAARAAFAHFARWLVARCGAARLVDCIELLQPRPAGPHGAMPYALWQIPNAVGVRGALAAVPEADYDAAVAALLAHADAVRNVDAERDIAGYLAYVLADDRPSSNHELRAGPQLALYVKKRFDYGHSRRAVPFIVDLPPSQVADWYSPSHRAEFPISDVAAAEAAATAIAAAVQAGESPAPALAWLLRDATGADKTTIAEALLDQRQDDTLPTLLPHVGSKLVRDALDTGDEAFPAWMLRAYVAAMDGKGEAAYGPRIATLLSRHGTEAARAWAKEGDKTIAVRLDRLIAAREVPLAPREDWPLVLRDPPWRRKTRAAERPEVLVAPIPTPFAHGFAPFETMDLDSYMYRTSHIVASMATLAAEIAETEKFTRYGDIPPVHAPIPPKDAEPRIALAWLARRLDVPDGSFHGFYYFNYGPWVSGVAWQPEPLALQLWDMTETLSGLYIHWQEVIAGMVSRFGAKAMPGLLKLIAMKQVEFLPLVTKVDAPELAPIAAHALAKVKRARAAAVAWLRANPATAATRLLPISLGPAGPERDAADAALGLLVTEPDGRAALDAAVAAYAKVEPRVGDAAFIDRDPLLHVPSKPPKLPPWIVPAALTRPRLAAGGALPDEAVASACEMLAFSSPLAPYAGVAQLREACTAESLDGFSLDLFRAWLAAGANVASEWAMRAMGDLGGDACARDLTRQIRAWGQAGLKPRGKAGIAVLAEIGTDVALMNLSAIAEKNPLLQLREAAKAAVAAIAEARGLSEVELADRLSPDLGLDDRGGLDLDFGPRRFRVGFDEVLRPWVRDADGKRLSALPRATKADDAEKAKAAGKTWAGLKKDAEATARLQITRLETMLATGRRVAPDVFWPFFAAHPLIRHLAGRLLWGLYADALPTTRPGTTFRLSEDLSASDAEDAPLDIEIATAPGLVGLVHPLHLGPDASARWAGLFADYEITQPFAQLSRETYALTPAEAAGATIDRFAGNQVAGRRLRGLRSQGWTTDASSESVHAVQRAVALADGSTLVAVLGFRDGFWHSPSREGDGVQTLEELTLTDAGWGASETRRFGDLDPVTASEVLRTPSLLVATGGE